MYYYRRVFIETAFTNAQDSDFVHKFVDSLLALGLLDAIKIVFLLLFSRSFPPPSLSHSLSLKKKEAREKQPLSSQFIHAKLHLNCQRNPQAEEKKGQKKPEAWIRVE